MMKLASGSVSEGNVTVSPELLQAAISDSSGDYHYHSVQREKTDAHAEKFHQVIFSRLAGCENRRKQTTIVL